ncbi:hypothetical protein MPSEU_000512800 [Mayamaea pseudoterrestris]|nr:hypothetical protein MPSEU_000512800 [Mayamaea pseudoterrestris]
MDSLAASNAGAFCSRVDHRSRRDAFEKRFGRRGLEEKKDIDSLIHITDDENDEDDEKLMHEVRVVQPLQQLPVQHLHGMAIHDELPRLNACLDESPSYQSLLEVLGRRPYMSPSSHGGEADEENFGNNESLPIPSRRCHLEQQHDSDNCPIRYYRIRYKGIANILSHPMVGAPRTGWYLGYGEVFFSRQILTSSCAVDNKPRARRRCLQTNGLSDEDGASCLIQDGTHEDIAYDVCINAAATASQIDTFIRIDGVLTGGYAMDSCNDPPLCAPADIDELDDSKTPRRSCTQQYTTGRSSLMNEHEYNDDVGQKHQ